MKPNPPLVVKSPRPVKWSVDIRIVPPEPAPM